MATILLSVLLMLLVFAAMAIGLAFGRQPIKGSCGGLATLSGPCEICGGDPAKCEAGGKPEGGKGGQVVRYDPRSPD